MDNILSTEQSTISSQDLIKYGYIYLTTNLINNKKYIGAHKSSCFDESYKGSGKILWRAINKYGWDNFKTEVVKWCYSKEELYKAEQIEIEERNAVASDNYYNVMPGGHGGDNKTNLSPEEHSAFIQKIKDSKRRPRTSKEIAHMKCLHERQKGSHRSEETKQRIREANLGQVRSEESRRHMSENHADFSGMNNPMYGVHLSKTDEDKQRISRQMKELQKDGGFMKGKSLSEETRSKMSKVRKGKIWMTNKYNIETMINPSELDEYFSKGFVRGRLRKSQKDKIRFND